VFLLVSVGWIQFNRGFDPYHWKLLGHNEYRFNRVAGTPGTTIWCCLVSSNMNRLIKYMQRFGGETGVVCGSLISEVKLFEFRVKRSF
jgi:hypothetical protein